MAYLIGEVTKELLETVHEFCEKEVRDLCRECDRSGEVPLGLFRQAMELQFHMLDIPECYGGLGLDKISAGALLEEMAKADAGFAVTFAASSLGLKPILFAGSEELKKEACALLEQGGLGAFCLTEPEAGSDAGAIKTRAEKKRRGLPFKWKKMLYHKRFDCVLLQCGGSDRERRGKKRNLHVLCESGCRGRKGRRP